MRYPRLRALLVALAGVAGLSACAEEYGGYGYTNVQPGYGGGCDPYYYDCRYYGGGYGGYGYGWNGWGADPWWGWYDGYYYPGVGFYLYDGYGRRYPWNENYRRYWEGRRGAWGQRNWNDNRWQRWDGYRNGGTGQTWHNGTQGGNHRAPGGSGTWHGGTGGSHGGGWHGGGNHGGGHRGH